MKKTTICIVLMLLCTSTMNAQEVRFNPNEILIQFSENATFEKINEIKAELGARELGISPLLGIRNWVISFPVLVDDSRGGVLTLGNIIQVADLYSSNPEVDGIGLNYRISPTPMSLTEVVNYLNLDTYNPIPDCSAYPGSFYTTTSSGPVNIAIVDTGADFESFPSLYGGLVTHTYDFINQTPNIEDDNSHGTSVSGVIASMIQSSNIPNASLQLYKALGAEGEGDVFDAIQAIETALLNGANLINLSWGYVAGSYDEGTQMLEKTLLKASDMGVVVIASAGNNDKDLLDFPYYPGGFREPKLLLSIAATSCGGGKSTFSNYSNHVVDLAAPGEDVLCPLPGGYWAQRRGTSFAAPILVGIAAQMASQYTAFDGLDLICRLEAANIEIPELQDYIVSGGITDAESDPGAYNCGSPPGGNTGGGSPVDEPGGIGIINLGYSNINHIQSEQSSDTEQGVNYYPNPFQNEIQIERLSAVEGMIQIEVFNAAGQLLQNTTQFQHIGSNNFSLSIDEQFGAGLFLIRLKDGETTNTLKLIRK